MAGQRIIGYHGIGKTIANIKTFVSDSHLHTMVTGMQVIRLQLYSATSLNGRQSFSQLFAVVKILQSFMIFELPDMQHNIVYT